MVRVTVTPMGNRKPARNVPGSTPLSSHLPGDRDEVFAREQRVIGCRYRRESGSHAAAAGSRRGSARRPGKYCHRCDWQSRRRFPCLTDQAKAASRVLIPPAEVPAILDSLNGSRCHRPGAPVHGPFCGLAQGVDQTPDQPGFVSTHACAAADGQGKTRGFGFSCYRYRKK
jgi:hypothetical protein